MASRPGTFRVISRLATLLTRWLWFKVLFLIDTSSYKVKPHIATYEWVGTEHILNAPCFYSFIEDWNRQPGATGHLTCRSAEFFEASFEADKTYPAEKETFTTSKGDLDLFATKYVRQVCTKSDCVVMSTGTSK